MSLIIVFRYPELKNNAFPDSDVSEKDKLESVVHRKVSDKNEDGESY